MDIIKSVTIKQILTDKRKRYLLSELHKEEQQIRKELEQLNFQLQLKIKKHQGNTEHNLTVRQNFNKEITKREEKLRTVAFKMHQLNKLEIGTEMKDGTIPAICRIQEGDSWQEKINESEIVIKDGIVHEIRKGMKKNE